MGSALHGCHDGVVGGVSDWYLCKDFDQGVECREVHIPSSVVSVQIVQFAPGLFCILLRVGSEFVEESFLHYAIVCHYISCWWSDVLDCAFEVGKRWIPAEMRSGLRYPSGNPLRSCSGRLRICLVFFFLLRRKVSVVVGAPLCLVLFLGMQVVQETLLEEEACFNGLFRLRP